MKGWVGKWKYKNVYSIFLDGTIGHLHLLRNTIYYIKYKELQRRELLCEMEEKCRIIPLKYLFYETNYGKKLVRLQALANKMGERNGK